MAIDDRYVFVDKPPQTGEALANLPLLKMYCEILKSSENSLQGGYGACYMKKEPAREVSFCYALNSVYRELLKWQNKQPDNPDIQKLRQEAVDLFQEVLPQEFPHIGNNYEIRSDYIEFDTKDPQTGGILDPQQFDITGEFKKKFKSVLRELDGFLNRTQGSQVYEEGSQRERKQQKRFDKVSFRALRKMQYYLTEKIENKQVPSFQSTEEKARAYRNTLKRQIEPLTYMNAENAADFERNQQILSNTLSGLGMRMVWCQEPPYEAEFVDNLYAMKRDLQKEQTPPEFYNTKLPVFLNLCKNMQEFSPQETQKMAALLKEFMEKPSKPKLIEVVEETQRVAQELRDIDQTKSRVMRAAWDGLIKAPDDKQLSPVIKDILKMRNYIGRKNLTPETQRKVDAYLKADYALDEYEVALQKSKIWSVCQQVSQFDGLKEALKEQMKAMAIPPGEVEKLKYNDIAFLLNRRKITNYKQLSDTEGVQIRSDKEKYLKDLVATHEKELRRSLFSFYQKKHTLSITLDGRRNGSSDQEITEAIAYKAKKEMNSAIRSLKEGKSVEDFNAHHIFPLSNIAYYERMSGKSFSEINKDILYINKDIHELLHINENAMDEKGLLHFGKDMACRTKYIHRDRMLREDGKIVGYYDPATMGIIMPKDDVKVMIDFNSYIFDAEKLSENVKLQEQAMEYRQAYDVYTFGQTQKRAINILKDIPQDESMTSKSVVLLSRLMEEATSVREYCSVAENFRQLQQNVLQSLQNENREPTSVEQSVLKPDLRYSQPIAVIPHVSSSKVSQFLTQAVDLLRNKAKEITMFLKGNSQTEQASVHPEMDKARQMVEKNKGDKEQNAISVSLQPQTSRKVLHVKRNDEQYA